MRRGAIHKAAIVIDGHNDLPWQFRTKKDLGFQKVDITRVQPKLHTDIPRCAGGIGAKFWAAYVPATTAHDHSAVKMTLEHFGGDKVNAVTCVLAAIELSRTLPWFAASVRDIRMLRIEKFNDLMPAIQQAGLDS